MNKKLLAFALIGFSSLNSLYAQTESKDTKDVPEAIELGGTVYGDIAIDKDHIDDTYATLGDVSLSAQVHLDSNLTANVKIKSEYGNPNSLVLDQAMAAWVPTKGPLTLYGGLQSYNLGLATTRLTSDVLLKELVDFTVVGGWAGYKVSENLSVGLSAHYLDSTFYTYTPEMAEGDSVVPEERAKRKGSFASVFNVDWTQDDNIVRLSSHVAKDIFLADLATSYTFGPVILDLEYAQHFVKNKAAAYYSALTYNVTDMIAFSARHELTTPEKWKSLANHNIAVGPVLTFSNGIYAAVEYGHDLKTKDDLINVQIGLSSSLKLPGMQRKTLVEN